LYRGEFPGGSRGGPGMSGIYSSQAVPASEVGAFATNIRAAAAGGEAAPGVIRPVVAPAPSQVLDKIKHWVSDGLEETEGVEERLQVYIRQIMCRKPDCVPLETIVVLLGDGWNVKGEILKPAEEVTQEDAVALVPALATAAREKVAAATAAAPAGDAAVEASTIVSASGATGAAEEMRIILPRDVEKIEPESEEVYIVGTNGAKVTVIAGLEGLAATMEELILRSHLITKMEGLSTLTRLTKLELYDNQIEELEELEHLPLLVVLDMSYNSIRTMAPVRHCPHLEELYLAQNKLRAIDGMDALTSLRKVDLGGNRIRSLEGIQHCTSLQELWIGKNKIEEIQHLEPLVQLRRLDIQANRLTAMQGLETLTSLEELYLSRNGISVAASLQGLNELNTIDLSNNRLESTAGIDHAPNLEEVWMSSNRIPSFDHISELEHLAGVQCVYLEHNPISEIQGYRSRLKALLPTLTQIDATSLP